MFIRTRPQLVAQKGPRQAVEHLSQKHQDLSEFCFQALNEVPWEKDQQPAYHRAILRQLAGQSRMKALATWAEGALGRAEDPFYEGQLMRHVLLHPELSRGQMALKMASRYYDRGSALDPGLARYFLEEIKTQPELKTAVRSFADLAEGLSGRLLSDFVSTFSRGAQAGSPKELEKLARELAFCSHESAEFDQFRERLLERLAALPGQDRLFAFSQRLVSEMTDPENRKNVIGFSLGHAPENHDPLELAWRMATSLDGQDAPRALRTWSEELARHPKTKGIGELTGRLLAGESDQKLAEEVGRWLFHPWVASAYPPGGRHGSEELFAVATRLREPSPKLAGLVLNEFGRHPQLRERAGWLRGQLDSDPETGLKLLQGWLESRDTDFTPRQMVDGLDNGEAKNRLRDELLRLDLERRHLADGPAFGLGYLIVGEQELQLL